MTFVFGDCEVHCERRELYRAGTMVHVEPQVFDLLVHLVRHRDRVVSKGELLQAVWHGRSISDDALSSRVSAARRAIGDNGAEQRLIRTVPRCGFRFVGNAREESNASPAPGAMLSPNGRSQAVQQNVAFCRTSDGVYLAVATAGRGVPLVKTANWLNHVEFDWQSPVWSPLFNRLTADCQLVRYDERGTGLSDRDVPDFSFEAFVSDLETVVDDCGLARFALLGISQGAPVAIAYAIRHPERVSRLVLCGGFALGWRKRGSATDVARAEASITLIREGGDRTIPRPARCSRRSSSRMLPMKRCGGSMTWSASPHQRQPRFGCSTSLETSTSRNCCLELQYRPLCCTVGQTLACHSSTAWHWRAPFPRRASWHWRARITSSCRTSQRGRASSMKSVVS
jgi:DNA-binding winged helix-turn-helix (wHTH) protein/pimeloyl-ACP methyl ester carboxylesterase